MTLLQTATAVQDFIAHYAVGPLLILFLGIFAGKVLEQLLLFFFTEFKRIGQKYEIIAYLVKWVFYIAAVVLAIASVGLLRILLWFLAGVVVTLIVVRIILGLVDFFPNFLAYHTVKAKYKAGAKIKTKLTEGTVERVMLVDTHIKTTAGDDVYIPNRLLRGRS